MSATIKANPERMSGIPTPLYPETTPSYRIFVRNLVVPFEIGIHDHERRRTQKVRVNVSLLVEGASANDDFGTVLNYETIVEGVRALAQNGHVELVETLGERILDFCLDDRRVAKARVMIEKLEVYPEAESVGVVLKRRRGKRHVHHT